MDSRPLVSVIVPVYRVEDYLPRCIDSLLNQTHHELDIILVDDGSPDNCGDICENYARRDGRVQVIHQENGGLSAARNAGIARSKGEYITFVDSDDWLDPEAVSHLVMMAESRNADIAICRFVRVLGGEASAGRGADSVRAMHPQEALQLYAGPTASLMTSACAKLYRASLFEVVRFPIGRKYEDEFTTHRLVALAQLVALSDGQYYFYAERPGSITQDVQDVTGLLDRVEALRRKATFFGSRDLPQVSADCLWRAFLIQRQLRPRAVASGDIELHETLRADIVDVAAALRRSRVSPLMKAIASLYAAWPQPVDAAIRVRQGVLGTRRGTTVQATTAPR